MRSMSLLRPRDLDVELGAASGRREDVQRSLERLKPFGDSAQAEPAGANAGLEPAAVVGDGELEPIVESLEPHAHRLGVRVTHGVVDRLLSGAVERELDVVGEPLANRAFDPNHEAVASFDPP